MKNFKSYFLDKTAQRKLPAPAHHLTYEFSAESSVTLYIDFFKDQIKDLSFELKNTQGYAPYLNALKELVVGKKIQEMNTLSTQDLLDFFAQDEAFQEIMAEEHVPLISYPLELFHAMILRYQGTAPFFAKENLICRCFGVYANDLTSFFKKNPKANLKMVGEELLAGSGCTRCLEDIEDLYFESYHTPMGMKERYQDKTPVEWLFFVDEIIKKYSFKEWSVDILNIQDGIVSLKIKGDSSELDKENFIKYLKQEMQGVLTIAIS